MSQSLSALNYIRNNKRRISVLIVSLSLSAMLFYVTQFLLQSTVETYTPILLENTKSCNI